MVLSCRSACWLRGSMGWLLITTNNKGTAGTCISITLYLLRIFGYKSGVRVEDNPISRWDETWHRLENELLQRSLYWFVYTKRVIGFGSLICSSTQQQWAPPFFYFYLTWYQHSLLSLSFLTLFSLSLCIVVVHNEVFSMALAFDCIPVQYTSMLSLLVFHKRAPWYG